MIHLEVVFECVFMGLHGVCDVTNFAIVSIGGSLILGAVLWAIRK